MERGGSQVRVDERTKDRGSTQIDVCLSLQYCQPYIFIYGGGLHIIIDQCLSLFRIPFVDLLNNLIDPFRNGHYDLMEDNEGQT